MAKDLKLHLPQTKFPMKGNLPVQEPQWIKFWNQNNIYQKIQNKNKNKPPCFLLDGPPYANGRIHLGTALNKILKDILIKQASMLGHQSPFIPFWDCHGLPIELRALKKIKSRTPEDVREACRKEAFHWVSVQQEQFQKLGVLADWENRILTMDSNYEAEEVFVLAQLVEKNLIYRGKRPIHWCFKLQTAVAASEIEYQQHTDPSIDVKFLIKDDSFPKNTFVVIWTTTPWTLHANQAVCVHPDFDYGLYKTPKGEHFIIAQSLKEAFEKRTNLSLQKMKSFKGSQLEKLKYIHPFNQKTFQVITGSHVTLDAGTGCVHTAPGHGVDDFIVGQKYNLDLFCPVDAYGKFTNEVPELEGKKVFEANPIIIETLKKSGYLVFHEDIQHSYPFNPRSKSPVIFRITDQWFLRFDDSKHPVREKSLSACDKDIQFVPPWSQQRLVSMLQESPDWCLSRQRIWGVPLPVFYCQKCDHPLLNAQVMKNISQKMKESQQGIEYYFKNPVSKLLPSSAKCENCHATEFQKGKDILDVWFDSGISHHVFKSVKGDTYFPAQIYLEGSDQHRGWFQTSLNSSIALNKKTPFKTLITHGFVYDLEKRKMSKSLGNIIDPEDVIKKHGAEILRLWVSSCDYAQDISSGEEVFTRVRETYRRFRNTIRFLLGNLNDFDPSSDQIPVSQMKELDQWILSRLSLLSNDIIKFYSQYEFHRVYQELNHFFTVQLSSIYLDIVKDRLYTFKKDSLERRSAQSALYLLLNHLVRWMAPISSFLSEEAYQFIPGSKKESIFMENFEKLSWYNKDLDNKFNVLLEIRQSSSKEIELLRKSKEIGSSLEVHLELTLPKESYQVCSNYADIKEFFQVSQITLHQGKLQVLVHKAAGNKCIRCWYYDTNLNKENLCSKCIHNL